MKAAFAAIVLILSALLALGVLEYKQGKPPSPEDPRPYQEPVFHSVTETIQVRTDRKYGRGAPGDTPYILTILRDLGFVPPHIYIAYDEDRAELIVRGEPSYVEALKNLMAQMDRSAADFDYTARLRLLEVTKGDPRAPEIDPRLNDHKEALQVLAAEYGYSKIQLGEDLRITQEQPAEGGNGLQYCLRVSPGVTGHSGRSKDACNFFITAKSGGAGEAAFAFEGHALPLEGGTRLCVGYPMGGGEAPIAVGMITLTAMPRKPGR